jgi:hypothetical protein
MDAAFIPKLIVEKKQRPSGLTNEIRLANGTLRLPRTEGSKTSGNVCHEYLKSEFDNSPAIAYVEFA